MKRVIGIILGLLFTVSCSDPSNELQNIKDLHVADVQAEFEKRRKNLPNGNQNTLGLVWDLGIYKEISLGDAMAFPVDNVDNLYVSGGKDAPLYPVNGTSFGFAYRAEEELRLELVQPVATEHTDQFTGYVLIWDWNGDLKRKLNYADGEFIGEENGRYTTGRTEECWDLTYWDCKDVFLDGELIYSSCSQSGSGLSCEFGSGSGSSEPDSSEIIDGGSSTGGGGQGGSSAADEANCFNPFVPGLKVPCNDNTCGEGMIYDGNGGCTPDWTVDQTFGKLCDDIAFLHSANSFKAEVRNLGGIWYNYVYNYEVDVELGVNCIDIPEYYIGTSHDAANGFAFIFNQARSAIENELEWGLLEPNNVAVRTRLISIITRRLQHKYPGATFGLTGCQGSIPSTAANYACE